MEALTRLVTESLARHGFDRPLDYRRLQWSRWFRCESPHSLLFVPSKPGVFAIAEEISETAQVAADAACPEPSRRVRPPASNTASLPSHNLNREGQVEERLFVEERPFRAASSALQATAALAAEGLRPDRNARRMLAVTQFFEDDDMAFVLDRMLSRQNPMQARLISGRYFVRFVVIEDQTQRRSICNALNQWIANSTEKATGIGSHFATSLELTPQTEYAANDAQQSLFPDLNAGSNPAEEQRFSAPSSNVEERPFRAASSAPQQPAALAADNRLMPAPIPTTPQPDPGAATNIHCPPFPSGF